MVLLLHITRTLSTTSFFMIRRLAKRSNPGLGHQITAIKDAVSVIKNDPEGFEGLESDLFNAHKSHKEHELYLKRQKEKTRQYIIKNKYFHKDPLPNLLTYAEKEQIRYLHSSDEEEWTVEKLAESFPANTETIRKILKANWTPVSPKRILVHDENVLRNWDLFKNGTYSNDMPIELYEHLKKFVERKSNDLPILQDPSKTFRKKQWQKPLSSEFSSIISSLKPKHNNTNNVTLLDDKRMQTVKGIVTNNDDIETYLVGEIKNKTPITIHELKIKNLVKSAEDSLNSYSNNSLDHLAAQKLTNISGTGIISENKHSDTLNSVSTDYTDKFTSNEVIISESDRKRYAISTTKKHIHIPRKLWRKGATYRANYCFYDDDGDFLYRVPGMANE